MKYGNNKRGIEDFSTRTWCETWETTDKKLTRAELERIARRKPLNAYEEAKIKVIKEFLEKEQIISTQQLDIQRQ